MDGRKLARLHRVRTLQLGLARAEEVAAQQRVQSEAALSARIADLAAAVSPVAATHGAAEFHAAAHYRERLHHSASTAAARVANAQAAHARAAEDARAARRDQEAVEKLRTRAEGEARRQEARALEDAPQPVPARFRHDAC